MRPLFEPLPSFIDPWLFAKQAGEGVYRLKLATTQLSGESQQEYVDLKLSAYVDAQQRHHLCGAWQLTLDAICQRCLQPMTVDLTEQFDYVLLRHPQQEEALEDEEGLICAEDTLDLAWFLEEEILLACPMISKHEDCQMPQQKLSSSREESALQRPFAHLKEMMNKE